MLKDNDFVTIRPVIMMRCGEYATSVILDKTPSKKEILHMIDALLDSRKNMIDQGKISGDLSTECIRITIGTKYLTTKPEEDGK